jgi:hypothetical protein
VFVPIAVLLVTEVTASTVTLAPQLVSGLNSLFTGGLVVFPSMPDNLSQYFSCSILHDDEASGIAFPANDLPKLQYLGLQSLDLCSFTYRDGITAFSLCVWYVMVHVSLISLTLADLCSRADTQVVLMFPPTAFFFLLLHMMPPTLHKLCLNDGK